MNPDSVTKTTTTSFLNRIFNSIAGILFGIILFLGSFLLLTWNEGRAVNTEKRLNAGASQVTSISADEIKPEYNGKLVHFSGIASAKNPVTDPTFGIVAEALKLSRNVEMYQWVQEEKSETKQKLGGGEETVTTYSYSKEWSSQLVDSSAFEAPDGHSNPTEMPVQSSKFVAKNIYVGAFYLPESLVESIDNFTPRPATSEEAAKATKLLNMPVRISMDGSLYIGADPATPEIGDLKITFEQADSGPVSVIAAQNGNTVEPFTVPRLGDIELLQIGTFSADAMFQQEHETNRVLTWLLRLVGFIMMLFGLILITKIVSVVASVIPLLGSLVDIGIGALAFALALPLTLGTIALAWIAYRPLIGIPLLLLAGVSIFFAGAKLLNRKKPDRPKI